jgi:amino acid adenylation domain-containing protein/non-ribosomal peptide synthase protein (TIGR01720 family)
MGFSMQKREHIQDIYPLTGMQQGMLFHSLYSDDNRSYFTQARLHFEGKIEINAFKQAWGQLLENHDILRTAFIWEGQPQPLQIVYKSEFVELPFDYQDWRSLDASAQQARLEQFLQADYAQGFDLSHAPLMRLSLIQINDEAFHFIWSHHHIVLDGWCLPRLVQESLRYYQHRLTGNKAQSINVRPYRDFIAWLKTENSDTANGYWKNYLAGFERTTPLTFGRADKNPKQGNAESYVHLSKKLTKQINTFVQSQRITVNTLVQGVWALLLSRYSGEEDVLCGVTVSGRPAQLAGSEAMIGLFINTLPLRVSIDNSQLLNDYLQALQKQNVDLRQFEHTPLSDIQTQSDLDTGSSLFDSLIVFENYPMEGVFEKTDLGFSLKLLELPENSPSVALSAERNNYPLTLVVAPEEQLMLMLSYQQARFSQTAIEDVLKQLEQLIGRIVQAPSGTRLGQLSLIEQEGKSVANTLVKPELVHQMIEAIACRYPANLAVVDEDLTLTYAELDARANQLAQALQKYNISQGQCIALCLQRSANFVVTLLGVLKAGCYYLPLDPNWPTQRINNLVIDSQASLLITELLQDNSSIPVIQLDVLLTLASQQSTELLSLELTPAHWAYLIYTSGSTGRPKGVAVSHRALSHYIHSINNRLHITAELKLGMVSTPAADIGHTVLFGALCQGAIIHMVPFETGLSPHTFAEYNGKHQLDIIKIAPSHLKLLLGSDKPIQVLPKQSLILGGEILSADFAEQIQSLVPNCRIINHYGPSETAVGVTTHTLSGTDSIPIGRALAHTRLYILDQAGQPLPTGVIGELYIGGESLADGYFKKSALTAGCFVPDPFSAIAGARMYKSGDRVFMNEEGCLVFIGRMDRQLNINGHRVELGEIEAVLQMQLDVELALARVYMDPVTSSQQLYAFLLATAKRELNTENIRNALIEMLPDFMIPQRFIEIQELPVSINGKVDETVLETLASKRPAAVFSAPSSQLELQLSEIWKSVLKLGQVSINDNFFELGGDSIMSLQIIAQARRLGYKITPKQIFDTPTIAELAEKTKRIEPKRKAVQKTKNNYPSGEIPLSPIQNWFFVAHPDGENHWNQALLFEKPATFVFEAFKTALNAVYEHHTALHLRFFQVSGKWTQQFSKSQKIVPEYIDISGVSDIPETIEMLCQLAQHSLNISNGPLFKVLYLDAGSRQQGRVLFVAHHLVIDAVSWRILLEDMETFYQQASNQEALQLPDHQTNSFSQWVGALQHYRNSQALHAELAYWSAMPSILFKAEIDGANTVDSIQTINTMLSSADTQDLLKGIHGAYRTRVDDIVLTAVVGALTQTMDGSAVTIELESHGRHAIDEELDLTRSIGWFTARYPVTLSIESNEDWKAELLSIKEQLRAVPNQGIGYGVLNYFTDKSSIAQIEASVCYNNLGVVDDVIGRDAWLKPANESVGAMRFLLGLRSQLLDVTAKIINNRLHLQWAYSANCLQQSSVERIANTAIGRLQQLIFHCKKTQGQLSVSDVPLSGLNEQVLLDLLNTSPDKIEDIYPLTPLQEGLLFHSLYAPNSGLYINQFSAEFDDLDINSFKSAWQLLLDRHEILRTEFRWGSIDQHNELSRPLQCVRHEAKLAITVNDLTQHNLAEIDLYWQQLQETDRQQGFDLTKAPLMRLHLIRIADKRYRLLWSRHHLLLDGWCSSQLMGELIIYYRSLTLGRLVNLPKPPVYRNYIAWLESKHQQQSVKKANSYWAENLKGISRATLLPGTFSASEQGRCITKTGGREWTEKLKKWAKTQGLTLNTICQGAWATLLSLHSGEQDVLFGVTVSSRSAEIAGIESMLGLFINSLPLRVKINPSLKLSVWLKALQDSNVTLRDYEHCSLTDIQAYSQIPSGSPLFESLLVFENYPLNVTLQTDISPLNISAIESKVSSHYPLMPVISPNEELQLDLYSRGLNKADSEALSNHFFCLLDQFMGAEDLAVSELTLLSKVERQILQQKQSTQRHEVTGNLILNFEYHALNRPDSIAVSFEDKSLSYVDLNRRANQLAHALIAQGITAESPVGLSSQPSLNLLVGILGILKAGGCYVPLDPHQPALRLHTICIDANIRWIVCDQINSQLQSKLKPNEVSWLEIEHKQLAGFSQSNPNVHLVPQQLAYIIYTSGSTGTPKGVSISHAQVLRLFSACEAHFEFKPDDVWSLFHVYSFDVSVFELWGAFLYGGQLIVVPDETRRLPDKFAELLIDKKVTVLSQTPSAFYGLSDALLNAQQSVNLKLRYLIFAGEALEVSRLLPWFKIYGEQQPQLINMYGTTETTVHATYRRLFQNDAEQPQGNEVGRPLNDLQAYVLDRHRQLLPSGVAGELYIGGAGVGRGYLARPSLTAERFIPDVFSGKSNARLYKTGDQAVCLADGSLRYLGRLDQQVQLRGFRIELGEVEAQIRNIPGITDTVVILREDVGVEPMLVAYLVGAIKEKAVREQLVGILPEYMLPGRYVEMQVLPLTINGKLDHQSLPKPDLLIDSQGHVAPRTETEQKLADIWGELLGLEKIGVDDNFFSLGGDSILCIQVAHRARSQGIAVNTAQLFEHQTIAELASIAHADTQLFTTHTSVQPFTLAKVNEVQLNELQMRFPSIADIYPLSPLQKGLWFHSIEHIQKPLYIEQLRIELTGELDPAHFRTAWQWVQNRYSALRSVFVWEAEHEPLQIILAPEQVNLPVTVIDWQSYSKTQQAKKYQAFLLDDYQQKFDFAQAPLMRFTLIQLTEQHYHFVWTHHHLLMDGWSLRLLVKDWLSTYQALQSGKSTAMKSEPAYRDYLAWLNASDKQPSIDFWQKTLAGFRQANAFPVSKMEKDALQSSLTLELSNTGTKMLGAFSRQQQLTLNTIISAAWVLLLSRYSGEQDIVFGATFSGRPVEIADIEQGVGLFINTLPVRVLLKPEQKLGAWLQTLQNHYATLQNHQTLPLSDVQQLADLATGQTLFNSLLVFENYPTGKVLDNVNQRLHISDIHYSDSTHYPLTLIASSHQKIRLRINYANSVLNDQQAKSFLDQLQTIVLALAKVDLKQPLANINLLSDTDKGLWFDDWNQQTQTLSNQTVIARFQSQAHQHPQTIAVMADSKKICYGNLNKRANRIAHALLKRDINLESRVGVLLTRGIDWLATVLGILKAGAVYVPIDPEYPVQRINYIAEDARLDLLIVDNDWQYKLDERKYSILWLADLKVISNVMPAKPPAIHILPENLAYIIYTSGSSGQPKGVAVSHHALENLVNWHLQAYQVTATDRASLVAGLGFDASVWELWPYLCAGASVVIADDKTRLSPLVLMDWLQIQAITIGFIPTPLAEQLLSYQWPKTSCLRYLLTGGDRLHSSQHNGSFILANNYGPTENTVVSTVAFLKATDSVPLIGRPILNTEIFILDKCMNLVAKGVAGELYLAGESLARGYIHQPGLTAERFIPHPFSSGKAARLYRTGDCVQLNDDNQLVFLGRIDTQIQFRGMRIEPNEVETALKQYSGITQAVVCVWGEDQGNPQLVAYFSTADNIKIDLTKLRSFLQKRIPLPMLPTLFMPLETFSLTAHGKIDRNSLPSPKTTLLPTRGHVVPKNKTEQVLCEIWQRLLNHQQISVQDDFFSLGGDSIICMQMLNNAEAQGIVLSIQQVFEQPTIEALASIASSVQTDSVQMHSETDYDSKLVDSDMERVIKENHPHAENAYPLTPLQKGFLFHALSTQATDTYIQQLDIELVGDFQPSLFQRAWEQALKRHAILRTVFIWEELTEPLQVVLPQGKLIFSYLDWGQIDAVSAQIQLEEIAKADREQTFDFKAPPLLRLRLCLMPDANGQSHWHFIVTHHHIIMDGWSIGLLFADVFRLYRYLRGGKTASLPDHRPYSDYLLWLEIQDKEQASVFWREQLANISEPTYLATSINATSKANDRALFKHEYDKSFSTALQRYAEENGVTLNTVMQSGWALLLSHLTRQRDVVFGATVAGRPPELSGIEHCVGLFINTLAVVARVNPKQQVSQWLKNEQQTNAKRLSYSYFPLNEVQALSALPNNEPLFDSLYVFENYPAERLAESGQTDFEVLQVTTSHWTHYPLSLVIVPGECLTLRMSYQPSRFETGFVEIISRQYKNLLMQIISKPDACLGALQCLDENQYQHWLGCSRGPQIKVTAPSVLQQFEAQVRQTPQQPAVIGSEQSLSYTELNQRANTVANVLLVQGIGIDDIVGLYIPRSIDEVISLLAVHKAGAAFMVLDSAAPMEHVRKQILDAGIKVLLSKTEMNNWFDDLSLEVINVGTITPEPATIENLNRPVLSEQLAYVIYTSGSTGTPKGVQISQQSLANHQQWVIESRALTDQDRVLHKTTLNFDGALWEVFAPLCVGASIIIASQEIQRDPMDMLSIMKQHKVSVAQFVPSLLNALIEMDQNGPQAMQESLRLIAIGGETLLESLVSKLTAYIPEVVLHNVYGPTETTVDASYWTVDPNESNLPIGHPVIGVNTYVLDNAMQPSGTWVTGELFISGMGVARGYLGRAALTAEHFLPDPFSEIHGTRMYRSGDLVYSRNDGALVFKARNDKQIKLRGIRIELGEIEAELERIQAIDNAVVVLQGIPSGAQLVAYLTGDELNIDSIRSKIATHLPEAMCPVHYVCLAHLPLLANGKLNRHALPAFDIELSTESYSEPTTPLQEQLCNIFQQVLKVPKVGIDDSFFALGGDSILSIQVTSKARTLNIELSPAQLFEHQTIKKLAEHVVQRPSFSTVVADKDEFGDFLLTPIQHWFFEQSLANRNHWNQAVLLAMNSPLQQPFLEVGLKAVVRHHDALRLEFNSAGKQTIQHYTEYDNSQSLLEYYDFSDQSIESQERLVTETNNATQGKLNIGKSPLLRAVYYRLNPIQSDRLFMVIHHLAVDGVSWRILFDDLQNAHQQALNQQTVTLATKTDSFKKWSHAVNHYSDSEALATSIPYWLALKNQTLKLVPLDNLQGRNHICDLKSVNITLSKTQTKQLLHQLPAVYNTRINDVLLAALSQTLGNWINSEQVLIALEGHGREALFPELDVTRTVGWFTSLFPVLLKVETTPERALIETKECLRRLPDNGIGFGILRYLSSHADSFKELPEPQISFNYLGQFDSSFDQQQSFARPLNNPGHTQDTNNQRQHLIDVGAHVSEGQLQLSWTYSADCFDHSTIQTLAEAYIKNLQTLIEHCLMRVDTHYTPSDFPDADLDEAELNNLFNALEK